MSSYIVGLTGGIASGKTEVSRRFESHGIVVADADVAAREVVATGSTALTKIAQTFGDAVLQHDGQLDRARLREVIFASADARRTLEAITHPAIRERLREQCESATSPYAIAAIPLLTEAGGRGQYPWLSRILLIDAPVEMQRTRLIQRDDVSAGLADRMIAAQASREQRLALADDVIENAAAAALLDAQVAALHLRYCSLA